jgi:hypothetical protein
MNMNMPQLPDFCFPEVNELGMIFYKHFLILVFFKLKNKETTCQVNTVFKN